MAIIIITLRRQIHKNIPIILTFCHQCETIENKITPKLDAYENFSTSFIRASRLSLRFAPDLPLNTAAPVTEAFSQPPAAVPSIVKQQQSASSRPMRAASVSSLPDGTVLEDFIDESFDLWTAGTEDAPDSEVVSDEFVAPSMNP